MKLADLKHHRVAIWGYGIEGHASADYLAAQLPDLPLTILCSENEADQRAVRFNHEQVTSKLLNQFDVVVKSPGISPYQPAVEQADCRFISATALWFSNERNHTSNPAKVIAITGTKGKSTSCYMLNEALIAAGFNSILAGNFGVPLLACSGDFDFIVLETSSYQAQDGAIQADIAVLLNLYTEHLDWHGSIAQYHQDKWRLLQQAKTVFVNAEDPVTQDLLAVYPLDSIHYFNTSAGFYILDEVLMYRDKALLSTAGWLIPGVHNLLNLAAVLSVLVAVECPLMAALNALKKLPPLPHRLQPLGLIQGVHVVNDSIASTPHATWVALQTCPIARTVLLVGGFERGVDWQWLAKKMLVTPPKLIICSGANGPRIEQTLRQQGKSLVTQLVPDLKSAVVSALQYAEPDDWLLLSPGAPSFDAFKNYQERGYYFEQWIKEYANQEPTSA